MSDAAFDLSGTVAVVTGANSGIGLAIADGLARSGADVAIWGRTTVRNETAAEQVAAHGTRVTTATCDVSDPAQVDAAFAQTLEQLGRIDSCFANAGVGGDGSAFVDTTLDAWRRVTATDLDGVFLTLQGAARHMVQRGGGGSLIAVSSLAASDAAPRNEAYAASKAGVVALVRGIAVELARHQVRANVLVPGWVTTPMTDAWFATPGAEQKILPRIPMRRWSVPEDLVAAAIYLAAPGSAYHTGDTLTVDGGYRHF